MTVTIIMALTYFIGICFFGVLAVISLMSQQWIVLGISMLLLQIAVSAIRIKVSKKDKREEE